MQDGRMNSDYRSRSDLANTNRSNQRSGWNHQHESRWSLNSPIGNAANYGKRGIHQHESPSTPVSESSETRQSEKKRIYNSSSLREQCLFSHSELDI